MNGGGGSLLRELDDGLDLVWLRRLPVVVAYAVLHEASQFRVLALGAEVGGGCGVEGAEAVASLHPDSAIDRGFKGSGRGFGGEGTVGVVEDGCNASVEGFIYAGELAVVDVLWGEDCLSLGVLAVAEEILGELRV